MENTVLHETLKKLGASFYLRDTLVKKAEDAKKAVDYLSSVGFFEEKAPKECTK